MNQELREKIELLSPVHEVPAERALAVAEYFCGGEAFWPLGSARIREAIVRSATNLQIGPNKIQSVLALQFGLQVPHITSHGFLIDNSHDVVTRILCSFKYGISNEDPHQIIRALDLTPFSKAWAPTVVGFGKSLEAQIDYLFRQLRDAQDNLQNKDSFWIAYSAKKFGYQGRVLTPTPEARALAKLARQYRLSREIKDVEVSSDDVVLRREKPANEGASDVASSL